MTQHQSWAGEDIQADAGPRVGSRVGEMGQLGVLLSVRTWGSVHPGTLEGRVERHKVILREGGGS